jgi:DNA-binding NtrC family response regulator
VANVLIADDEAHLAETLAEVLRGAGHEVRVAPSGAEALSLAREFHPDLLISDWVLGSPPNGMDLIEQMRVTRAGMRAILMTGYPSARLRTWAGADPRLAVLEKPFSLAELRGLVARVLAVKSPA